MLGHGKQDSRPGKGSCSSLWTGSNLSISEQAELELPEYVGVYLNSRGDFLLGRFGNWYWAVTGHPEDLLNLFLFLPRSTIPYLQLLGQMCFRTEKYVNFRKVMWCIPVSYLAPEWGLAQHPIIRHWERSAVRRPRVHTGNIQSHGFSQILPPDEHAPAVEPPAALWVWIAYKGLWI